MSGFARLIAVLMDGLVITALVAGRYGWQGIWAEALFWAALALLVFAAMLAIATAETPRER